MAKPSDTKIKTIQILISGKVQGVFFRQSTREKALELGIVGSVRNNPDQTVEIVATGEEKMLDSFIDWCHLGPPRATINRIECKQIEFRIFHDFSILR